MGIKIIYKAVADTDYTIAYIDGRPAAIMESKQADAYGYYITPGEREYVVNRYAGSRWYIMNGEWEKQHVAYPVFPDTVLCSDSSNKTILMNEDVEHYPELIDSPPLLSFSTLLGDNALSAYRRSPIPRAAGGGQDKRA